MPSPEDDLDGPGVPLQFSEPIAWKVGRPPIAVSTLMKRLKQLLTELCTLEQETVDRRSLASAARDLCTPALLQHKDRGVKAFVACGLAEMLRLHAPDAPYTAAQLRVSAFFFTYLTYVVWLHYPSEGAYYGWLLVMVLEANSLYGVGHL